MNVFDFAMRMEEEHRAYYDKLAAEAKSKGLKTIFTLLADSEREHQGHLMLLKAGTDPMQAWSMTLERAQKHISELVDNLAPADILQSDYDGYRHAIRTEEMSIKLYEKLANQESNRGAAELLRRMADEERHHLEVMENIYEFVEAPRTYLAWGEFSNLREY
ncbi:MAG: ferritin family protein [Geobacteraceae bacterium]|nr:ferritin family protein [Geobacteraceae bacterium]